MSFEIIKGDLIALALSGEAKIIAHGCNCFHAMGSGIAAALASKFPQIPLADQRWSPKGAVKKLGGFSTAQVTQARIDGELKPIDSFECLNIYTQYQTGADFIPSIFPAALKLINDQYVGETIWFPMIGCGTGS